LRTFRLLALEGTLNALITRSTAVIEVDLSRVTFVSCGGLTLILRARKTAGNRFVLVGAAPAVRRLLDILELSIMPGPASEAERR
jgi:anti-anti-sigma factor